MSWAGFGSYGSGASAYANRGGPLSSGYTRGGYRGGGGSYGFGASGLHSGSTSAYRTTGLSTAALSSAGPSRGTGTARVAVLGTTHSVFMHWWALHAAGFQVSVVVGALDARRKEDISSATTQSDGESKTFASASAAEQLESANAARDTALRCVEFYRLPKRASSSANGLTGVSPMTTTSQSTGSGVTTAGSTADSKAEALASVIVRLSDEKATASAVASAGGAASSAPPGTTTAASSPSTATKTTTTLPYLGTAATTGSSATATPTSISTLNKAEQDAKDGATITATSWSFFFKPFLEAQAGTDSGAANSSGGGSGGGGVSNSGSGGLYGASRAMSGVQGADSLAGKAESLPLLVDDVEVVYLAAYTHIDTPTESFMDESALRAALIWLLGKGKHLVVDCALSCATVAACAAAAATTTRGKTEMQRLFVYRGGGTRYGWSTPAMTELRKALAVSRGTGQARKAADGSTAPASASSPTPTATTATTTAKVAESPAGGKPKTPEAADAFSVFDLMGSDSNPFAGALKDADTTSSSAAAAAAATPHQASVSVSTKSLGDTAEPEKPKPPPTIVTSLALDAEAGVVGALRQVRLTVRGCGFGHGGPSTLPCSPSLGIMDTLGWDAVACVLHLLDWTCPDMVQGRVIRRCSSGSRAPLCVEAELFYGIDGSVPAAEEGEKKGTAAVEGGSGASDSSPQSQSTATAPVSAKDNDASQAGGSAPKPQQQQQCLPSRPAYLRVLLHVGAVGVDGSTGTADGSSSVFQQSLRAVGSKAVVTVTHPLLPAVSTAAVKLASSAGGRESASPSPSQPATSPFKFTTTRTMSGVGLGTATPSASASAATAAAGDPSLPGTPAVVYEYVVATQDAPPGSSGRLRKEKKTVVAAAAAAAAQSNGAEEACAEARLWQRVRGQLNVSSTTTAAGAASTTSSGFGVGGGGYQPYGSRYATRGRYGASVGLGGAAGGYYGRGRGVGGSAGAVSTAPQTVVKAEVNAAEAAALDVQRAWMVQMVVEQILASAASG